ncbi:fimbrial protein [Providencia rettgeri]|nr:fimbrial protein [Providencia rettgeri]ELL9156003.1 fimbrial protein [Providencia rettgeri]
MKIIFIVIKNKVIKPQLYLVISLLFCSFFCYRANSDNLATNIQIRVSVYGEPDCKLSGGTSTAADFGDVHQALIDGSYKRLAIDYNLICTDLYQNGLKMTLTWANKQINGQPSVSTNLADLGIAIYKDNTLLRSGATFNFNYGSSPKLYAVPVKPIGENLSKGGEFTGNITITLDYQ